MTALDIARLALHVNQLATAFSIDMLLVCDATPEEGHATNLSMGGKRRSVIVMRPVVDETSYITALHEMGHHLSPFGQLASHLCLRAPSTREEEQRVRRVQLDEETAAWEWARHHALYWSASMEAVYQLAYQSYEQAYQRSMR